MGIAIRHKAQGTCATSFSVISFERLIIDYVSPNRPQDRIPSMAPQGRVLRECFFFIPIDYFLSQIGSSDPMVD